MMNFTETDINALADALYLRLMGRTDPRAHFSANAPQNWKDSLARLEASKAKNAMKPVKKKLPLSLT